MSTTGQADDLGLDTKELDALRAAGRTWAGRARAHAPTTSPLDAELMGGEEESTPWGGGDWLVPRASSSLYRLGPGFLQMTPPNGAARGRGAARLRRALLGAPIATRRMAHERLTKVKALAVLSSDALSSVAYATEQILLVLVAAGAAAYSYSLPIAAAILVLLLIVVLSYRQTIRAYPKGGGSYIVASDNLGPLAGLVAGCALMTSYTLTVSVSVASGVDAIISAAPGLDGYRVQLCVTFIALLVLGNLRGIRESGSIFAAPTYLFVAGMFAMLGAIAVKLAVGDLHSASPHLEHATQTLTLFLILRAFASGATALTGVEAISDGVPAFKPPEWKNARRTLVVMGLLLGLMFAGITLCAHTLGIVPQDPNVAGYQTVISQLAHAAFGSGVAYIYIAVATTAILVLAGNTAFSDFPRLFFFMARDDYAPHQFKRLGDRLAFSNGIIVLGVLATLLVVVFRGNVSRLIPLYAIGVFTAFTMSQAGMVVRWLRRREPGWQRALPMNAIGVVTTGLVAIITGVSKFTQGAWIIVVLVPILVMLSRAVHRHYTEVGAIQTETPTSPDALKPICIVPIADLNGLALQSLAVASAMSDDVVAIHVNDDRQAIAHLRAKWDAWGDHVKLEIIDSPYRALVRPLLAYIDELDRQGRGETVVVILPEMVATRWWHNLLHNQTALRLKAALLFRPGTVVVSVPYHLRSFPRRERHREHLIQRF